MKGMTRTTADTFDNTFYDTFEDSWHFWWEEWRVRQLLPWLSSECTICHCPALPDTNSTTGDDRYPSTFYSTSQSGSSQVRSPTLLWIKWVGEPVSQDHTLAFLVFCVERIDHLLGATSNTTLRIFSVRGVPPPPLRTKFSPKKRLRIWGVPLPPFTDIPPKIFL